MAVPVRRLAARVFLGGWWVLCTGHAALAQAPDDLIYEDGFEDGSLAAWSASATDGGDLVLSCSMKGSRGASAVELR